MEERVSEEPIKPKHTNNSFGKLVGHLYLPTIILIALVFIISIGVENNVSGTPSDTKLDEIFGYIVDYAALFCELAAVFVIFMGTLKTIIRYIQHSLDGSIVRQMRRSDALRIGLGPQLSLSLEFAMASDILRIARSPSFSEIIILLAIVLLRVLLNFFLDFEVETICEKEDLPELEHLDKEQK
jgi:uncharacterized membrane protein